MSCSGVYSQNSNDSCTVTEGDLSALPDEINKNKSILSRLSSRDITMESLGDESLLVFGLVSLDNWLYVISSVLSYSKLFRDLTTAKLCQERETSISNTLEALIELGVLAEVMYGNNSTRLELNNEIDVRSLGLEPDNIFNFIDALNVLVADPESNRACEWRTRIGES